MIGKLYLASIFAKKKYNGEGYTPLLPTDIVFPTDENDYPYIRIVGEYNEYIKYNYFNVGHEWENGNSVVNIIRIPLNKDLTFDKIVGPGIIDDGTGEKIDWLDGDIYLSDKAKLKFVTYYIKPSKDVDLKIFANVQIDKRYYVNQ